MFTSKKTARRAWAGLTAGAMLLGVGALAAPIAIAAPTVLPTGDGSITITKHLDTTGNDTDRDNGAQNDALDSRPTVAGVTFTITPVLTFDGDPIDLTTNEGWQVASAFAEAFDPADFGWVADAVTNDANVTLGTSQSLTTGSSGRVVFGDSERLPLGLYLVQETGTPAGVVAPIENFLVTLPLTDPDNLNDWLYDVFLYPKNAFETTADKATIDADAASQAGRDGFEDGDHVGWRVAFDIPAFSIDTFVVTDKLDSKLTYVEDSMVVSIVDGDTHDSDLADTDFTVEVDDTGMLIVRIVDGIDELEDAASRLAAPRVVLTFDTTVDGVGTISNTANLFVNATESPDNGEDGNPGGGDDTYTFEDGDIDGEATNPAVTKWGQVTVKKTTEDANPRPGATFQLWATRDAATFTPTATSTTRLLETVADTEDGDGTADGTLVFAPIRFSNAWDDELADAADAENGEWFYFLVETVAPEGYELLAAPVAVESTGGDQTFTSVALDVPIVNVPANAGFQLPLTGGQGTALLTIGGLLILGSASVLVFRRRHTTEA